LGISSADLDDKHPPELLYSHYSFGKNWHSSSYTLVGSQLHACYKLAVLKYMIQDCTQQMPSIIRVFVLMMCFFNII
jgi:hypothetical protein